MNSAQSGLRVWPGVIAVTLQWLIRFGAPMVMPDGVGVGIIGEFVGVLAILVWWLFFSRAPMLERLGAIVVMAAVAAVTPPILDKSIVNGMMGMMFPIFVIPTLCLALVGWAVVSRNLTGARRLGALVAATVAACLPLVVLRTNGVTGDGGSQLAWRWTKTAEDRLLATPLAPKAPAVPTAPAIVAASVKVDAKAETPSAAPPPVSAKVAPTVRTEARTGADWPGFRGPHRDDRVPGVRIKTDWAAAPPVVMWRRPVGPGWSSFAVRDGIFYTQEQRGEFEIVAAYKVATGEPMWTHRDNARFWESNAGAGPRGTPTLGEGRVYTFGATGILNALDAANGAVIWSRNAPADTGAKTPEWGFASSPLLLGDVLIVATSGRLAAYDIANGKPIWLGPEGGGGSYSSPHFLTIDGVPQIVLLSGTGATSVAPADGKVLWKHAWEGFTSLQPALTADGNLLITTGSAAGGNGTRRLAIKHGSDGWKAEEVWTSTGLKPYFNDLVVHDGHAYGFDGGILSCIDLKDGKRAWKGGRYGHGQLLLLTDQDLLLVLSEEGEVALVGATPGQYTEIAKIPAMEGKTWNHPVVAGDILLVRNSSEMVGFRLPVT